MRDQQSSHGRRCSTAAACLAPTPRAHPPHSMAISTHLPCHSTTTAFPAPSSRSTTLLQIELLGLVSDLTNRLNHVQSSEPMDTSAITANNATTLLSVEISECLAFSGFQCFLLKTIVVSIFQTGPSHQHVHPACCSATAGSLSRSTATRRPFMAGQHTPTMQPGLQVYGQHSPACLFKLFHFVCSRKIK